MSKKKELPLFSDTLKKTPKRLIIKKNPYHEVLEDKYSGSMGGNKKLQHKRERRKYKNIIEEELDEDTE